MKKASLILFLFIVVSQAFSQITILEEAYKNKSKERLDEFFEYWRKDVFPISDKEFQLLSDTLKEVYGAFEAFYQPLNLDKIGESDGGIYNDVDYLIVQTGLELTIREKVYFTKEDIDSIDREIESKYDKKGIDSIRYGLPPFAFESASYQESYNNNNLYFKRVGNLRPRVLVYDKNAVYLTDLYGSGIAEFLGTRLVRDSIGYRYTRFLPIEEVLERKKFIEQNVKIELGHWGAYWHLITFPEVNSIVFDKDFQYAKILFRIVYQGGEAMLKKEEGKWKILSSELTWIE